MFHCWVVFLLWEAVLYRSIQFVQSVQQVRVGTENEAVLGMENKVDFRLLVVVFGPYGTVRTVDCWHGNRGT
jgi:hypothetical protein